MAAAAILKNHKNHYFTASDWPIFAKFGTIMQNGSQPSRPLKNLNFQNPRWRTAAISKTVKSSYLRNRLTDFDEIWHDDADWPSKGDRPLKFRIFSKTKMAAAAILKSHKNRDISVMVWPIFIKFGTLMQNVSLNRSDY